MNNIYKVIWSKAKNCYVVASEIARSHTKSATGSEKIGGVTRRSLLASLMALSLLCGGLGVASAANGTVHVAESAASSDPAVYTTEKVNTLLEGKADKTALENKANATDVAKNTENIATNTANINTLRSELGNKADESTVTAALGGKANTSLNNLDEAGKSVIKTMMADELAKKADKSYVDNAVAGAVTTAGTNVNEKLKDYAKTTYVDTEVGKKANKATTLAGYEITDAYTKEEVYNKGEVARKLDKKADLTALNQATDKINDQQTAIDDLKDKTTEISYADGEGTMISGVTIKNGNIVGDGNSAITQLANVETDKIKTDSINGKSLVGTTVATAKDVEAEALARTEADNKLEEKITKNTQDIATLDGKVTTAEGNITDLKKKDTELEGRIKNNEGNIETNKNAISDIKQRTAGIDRINATNETTIEGNVTVDNLGNVKAKGGVTADGKLKGAGVDAGDGAITTTGAVIAGSLNVENASHLKGDVTMDNTLTVKGDTSLNKTDVGGALNVTGASDLKGDVTLGTPNGTNTVTVNGTANFYAAAKMNNDLTVTGDTNLGNTTVDGKLKVTGTITTDKMVFGDPATNNYTEIDHGKVTSKNSYVNGEGQLITSSSTFDAEKNEVGFTNTATGDHSYHKQTADGIKGYVTDKDGNKTYTKVTATENSFQVQDKDGKNKNHQVNTKDSSVTEITNAAGKTTKTEQTAENITNTAKDGTIKNDAKDIVNNASGNITNTAQNGTIKNEAKDIVNNATGDMTNEVGGKLTTTVTGQATENFNGGLDTTVTGTENHTVNGKQINTVTEGQENIISGGQTNTITGGQINNITGDQTTTITGNKKETVTENVTEDYQKDLTTTVGGNENHEVKGTKTETVEGKVTENYKAGQATNVTGDQDITVSGTQTTTATDINRNASSGMIDRVENASGSNTETKVAGQTTTDVKLASGEEGKYIRGANESRDYLIKDTLKNSETKTAEATSTEITDGTNTASTKQDAKNLAGSVTNGTETGVSGIHANKDGSVSIDSAVSGEGGSSVINQKKDSIQSAVGDGTNSTVIHQDKDNVTIASSNGMVGLVGKDIVNNAQNTITNTAGTSITNQVKDSKVTTDANGTTFENNTPAVSDVGTTTTKINGNHINTGRVDANELGVSDKDGANTADLSVKAGEGVKASAGNGTTTGSLDVKADEVVSSVKDADGKGSTFKQRIDAIMMESKDVSITAEETLTNEAKVITNRASEVINNEAININNTAKGIITSKASEIKNQADKLISNKVGENTWENMENGKITTSIKDGAKQNLTQSDAEKTEHSVVNGSNSTVNKQTSEEITDAVTNGTTTNVTQNTATSSNNTIADKNGNANTVISTVDGTSFINSKAAAPVTGASGAGTAVNTTIKGNTITTGKVTMDYAQVMRDLGVNGNANIDGKTTTGSLEVKGESKLTGNVTMENNATVGNDLTVKGITTTKTLKVTENAEIDGNATIKGDVTANSYKVGDKTYISADGINANDQKITNVADGSISEGSKDAVNGGQLYGMKTDLEHKVDKVGANAAAMANLHPMEFDPDSKWNIAAAMGNYGSETATAIGAFYRPNEDVMVNFSTAFGTGENMVGGGVSVRLGKGGNKLSREETNALKAQVNDLTARMDALLSVLNPNMSKDFPDVPENHWAYEAVSRLAGNDIVQGYPDGEFHGDRTMTRYEMAEIIYNALSRGAEAERELVEEFKPELQAMAASEKATAERAEG